VKEKVFEHDELWNKIYAHLGLKKKVLDFDEQMALEQAHQESSRGGKKMLKNLKKGQGFEGLRLKKGKSKHS
jgi:hypothetical protein